MTFVLLNEAARHHQARRLWSRIEPEIRRGGRVEVVSLDAHSQWEQDLARAVERGHRHFIAAGGDGTVGSLVDGLVRAARPHELKEFTLGAVGLGSSNDFHKPYSKFLAGVPVRLDRASASYRDLARVSYLDANGAKRERCFAVSASVGVVASANALFNDAHGAIGYLKVWSSNIAIAAAALTAIFKARSESLIVTSSQFNQCVLVTNLSIAKTRHLAGAFTYDTPVLPNDGLLSINLCEGMSRGQLLWTLMSLCRGRFRGLGRTHSWSTEAISVSSQQPFDLELDGEVLKATRVHCRVIPKAIRVCS